MFDSIYVELTNVCNMACDFCTNPIATRPKKYMDFDLFLNIIDQIVAHHLTKHIRLAAIGESLLYPRLLEVLEYCTEKNLKTSMITNGLVLTTGLYQELVNSGLKKLEISLHDLTENSFAYRHSKCKIDYGSFYENIIRLIDYHVSHDIPTHLTIFLIFCKEQWISSQLWDLPAIKKNTKKATVLLQGFMDEMNEIAYKNKVTCHLNKRSFSFSLRSLNVSEARRIRIMGNVFLKLISVNPQLFNTRKQIEGAFAGKIILKRRTTGGCSLLGAPMVLSDGSFVPCCQDGLAELVMGKVTPETSLISLINSEEYQSLVEGFKSGRIINPVCQECRGRLVYENPLLQMGHLVSSFNIYALIVTLVRKYKPFLSWKLWWRELSAQSRNKSEL